MFVTRKTNFEFCKSIWKINLSKEIIFLILLTENGD